MNAVLISGDLGFLVQRQGRVVVIQCFECGEHTSIPAGQLGAAHKWQRDHKQTCEGDDGH